MSKQEVLTAAYAAFNRRDIDAVLALMRPDVDWPNGMDGGRVHGHDEVRSYWRSQWSVLNPRVEPMRIEDDETGNTVVQVHQVVRDLSGNILVDQIVQHVYSIKDELIERMDIRHPDTGPTHEGSNRPTTGSRPFQGQR
jgi:ketosteroid isomerase-like protein